MRLVVNPSPASGTIAASPSKSYSHRALTFGLLADGRSQLREVLLSGDTLATLGAARLFGARAEVSGPNVTMDGGKLACPEDVVDCENSGTTMRLMAGVASLLPCATVLTGDASIRKRPMQPLIDALRQLGVECASTRGNGLAPLIVKGPNKGSKCSIKGDVSSQFISSLLICSALKEVDTEVELTTPLKSRPYVEITMGMMRTFGARVEMNKRGFLVEGRQRYVAQSYRVPGDYSSAAFPLAAGALTAGVAVTGLDPEDKQGDRRIVDIMEEMGAEVRRGQSSLRVSKGRLQGITIDLADAPDLFPIAAVLGTQAKGRTEIVNAEHVRLKESDRIKATADFLKAMGAEVRETRDGCVVQGPSRLHGAIVDSLGDHRILMAAAVAAMVAQGTTSITEGDCYRISYPGFVEDMSALGANMRLVE
ncbi:MAG: 3-phosphoshikimate 1-carboxyvinyltransferase [Methanomassiliicoccales archaeon]|nr:3-phosphoshikimate 1-carboxyvinyltransferase [Methanomassiliicoccales archaeon]